MTHTEIRDALTDGRADAEVVDHLASCPSCRSFATAIEHILQTAPRLAGSPPTDLADRVLAAMDLDTHGAGSPPARDDDFAFLPALWAGAGRRLTAVAAALLLVVGLTAVLQRTDESDPRDVVLASAGRTTAAGSAQVEVDAEAEVVVDIPDTPPGEVPSSPDLSHVPVEMHAHVQREWARIMADFEVQLREFQEQVDATMEEARRHVEEAQRQMEESMRQMQEAFGGEPGSWTPPAPPEPPDTPAEPQDRAPEARDEAPPSLPTSLSSRVTVQASGSVAFGERLRLEGRARSEGDVASGDASRFGLAVDGDTAAYLGPDRSWAGLPGATGPLGGVLLDTDAVARVLSSPQGEVELVGDAEVDGRAVRRYRFTVDGATITRGDATGTDSTTATWTAEAWIDSEGRTRRLELSSDSLAEAGTGTVWRTRIGLELSDFGVGGPDTAPPVVSRRAELPTSASLLLYPFGPNIGAAADTDGETGR